MILYILIQGKGDRKRLRCTYRLSGRVRIISGVDHNHWNGWGGTSSMDGSQSLELGVSITGIHMAATLEAMGLDARYLIDGFAGWQSAALPESIPLGRRCYMKWSARERPKIDQIACPWLITRFIDTEPVFLSFP